MKYVFRALKYLVRLALLLAVIFALMQWGGMSNIEGAEGAGILGFFKSFIATTRGQIFTAALVVWCAVYPAVEFKRRHLNYDMETNHAAIIKALHAGGMTLVKETQGGRMIFHGSMFRRVWWMGDDAVTITRNATGGIDIEGPRRFVMEAQHRIPTYVGNEE